MVGKSFEDREMKLKWLDRSLILSTHYFTLCTTEKLFKKALKHLRIPKSWFPPFLSNWHSSATVHYFENRDELKASCVVCIGNTEGKSQSQVFALLTHEAVHMWQQIKEAIGEHSPSPEFEAYAVQSISQQLFEEYERQTK